MNSSRQFRVARAQWQGMRAGQEDTCAYIALDDGLAGADLATVEQESNRLLAVLADGMGGHVGGQHASRTACTAFINRFRDTAGRHVEVEHCLGDASEFSNEALAREVENNPELKGMGCTLVASYFQDQEIHWVSVGDSLLCQFQAETGRIRRLNEDHSMTPVLWQAVERGELSREDAVQHPHRNALRSALTGGRISLRDVNGLSIAPGDCIILASDGLLALQSTEMEQVIGANRAYGPVRVANALIDAVKSKERPDQDNTSIVIVELFDGSLEPTVRWAPSDENKTSVAPGVVARRAVALFAITAALVIAVFAYNVFVSPIFEPSTGLRPGSPAGGGENQLGGASPNDGATTPAKGAADVIQNDTAAGSASAPKPAGVKPKANTEASKASPERATGEPPNGTGPIVQPKSSKAGNGTPKINQAD